MEKDVTQQENRYLPVPMETFNCFEVWWPVEGYEGLYEVSSLGRVRSLDYNRTGVTIVLKQTKDKQGYFSINLRKNGKTKSCLVSRLVCNAFHGLPNGYEADHLNWVRDDNRFDNLHPLSKEENIKRVSDKGREARSKAASRTIKMVNDKYRKRLDEQRRKGILQYDLQGNLIREWPSMKEASETLGIHNGHICSCCRGKRNKAGGYIWKYKNNNGED